MQEGLDLMPQIRDKARELLTSGAVDCVIGYERASDGLTARPLFAYEPEDVDKLIFDQTCVHNLARFLVNKRDSTVAIVAKPCDSRAINLLLSEKQIQRERVYVIGVVCPGIVEATWGQIGDKPQVRCQICREHTPLIYDFLVGEPPAEEPPAEPYHDVAEMEAKSIAERQSFWAEQFARCIRCYACRQACPGCYCTECFAEQLDPLWVGIKIARKLKDRNPELEVIETSEAGIALLDLIAGYDKLIIIDSIRTEKGKPGELYKLGMEALKPAAELSSSHGIGIATAYEIGQRLGYMMPEQISIYAVEIEDNTTFGVECTGGVEVSIPFITEQIIREEKL